MATAYKILGSGAGEGESWTRLYTVPTGKSIVVSSLVLANTSMSTAQTIGVRVYNPDNSLITEILPSSSSLAAQTRVAFTEGWALQAGAYVDFYGSDAVVKGTLFGSEIS